VVELEVRYCFP